MEEKKGAEHVWCGALLGSIRGVQQVRWGIEGIHISVPKLNKRSSISAYSSRLLVSPKPFQDFQKFAKEVSPPTPRAS